MAIKGYSEVPQVDRPQYEKGRFTIPMRTMRNLTPELKENMIRNKFFLHQMDPDRPYQVEYDELQNIAIYTQEA